MIAGHAALLALKARPPGEDRLRPRRGHGRDDQAASVDRAPPHRRRREDGTHHRDGHRRRCSTAARTSRSRRSCSRAACIHAAGPYRCDARAHPRPRGVDEHAAERRVPRLRRAADAVRGRGPHGPRSPRRSAWIRSRLRERNALRPGDTTATGQMLGEDASALAVLRDGGAAHRASARKRKALARHRTRGIGLALFFHGSGFTGGGELKLASRAALELTATRRAHPRRQHRDRPGHAHHARADRRRRARHPVRARRGRATPTRRVVPDSGPTVASRTCMVVGRILERCARGDAASSSAA